jgi:DNA-directed RNA polymerase subunit alpha
MRLKPFHIPQRVEVEPESLTPEFGRFIISPLERGWGHTTGNSLRRALLSSVQGASISELRIDGVVHEFSTLSDVLEDVAQIVLNLKKIRLQLNAEVPKLCYLHARGKGEFCARDLEVPPEVEIKTPDQKILTITSAKRLVNMELKVENGRGWVAAERLKKQRNVPPGVVVLDCFFSPVKKVNYRVESTRFAERTDYEKVIMEVATDGTVKPEEAVIQAATILRDHMAPVIGLGAEPVFIKKEEKVDREREHLAALLHRDIDELEISHRASNSLKHGRLKSTGAEVYIKTIGDLVRRTEKEMLDIENFGRKSLMELKEVLGRMKLSFGMNVDQILGEE